MVGARIYFSYGSNMVRGQMAERCPTARFVGLARLRDHRFRINRRGVATIIRLPGSVVHGVLWRLTPADEAVLNRYEGVELGVYRRVYLPVEPTRGPPSIPALVYAASNTTPGHPRPKYLEEIVDAARQLGFPPSYCTGLAVCGRPPRDR